MSASVPSHQKRRGRPRSEKARTAILDAATELLLEQGLEAVSMDEVAAVPRQVKGPCLLNVVAGGKTPPTC